MGQGNGFDVTMGAYAETCELIGMLNAVINRKKHSSENTGLNRDDDLSIFRNASRPELKKLKSPYRKYSRKKC